MYVCLFAFVSPVSLHLSFTAEANNGPKADIDSSNKVGVCILINILRHYRLYAGKLLVSQSTERSSTFCGSHWITSAGG
jgi:hypothetical protein